MPITLNGSTGITNDSAYVGDGINFADNTPANTLVTTTAGRVGVGTAAPQVSMDVQKGSDVQIRALETGSTVDTRVVSIGGASLAGVIGTYSNHPLVVNTNATERMRIDSSGNVLVSTAGVYLRLPSASTNFDISGQAGANDFLRINANGTQRFQFSSAGQAYNSTGTWGTISDARLKENIVDATSKLDKVNQLRVVNFNLKSDPDVKQIGFIAQEMEEVFPSLVQEGEEDGEGGYFKSVKTTVLIPILVKAIQEQQAIINDLKARIETLEKK